MYPLEFRFKRQFENTPLWPVDSRLIVAISGGADSVALTRLLHASADELHSKIQLVHVNYGLRKGADDDQAFVKGLAQELGLALEVLVVSEAQRKAATGESTQAWARKLRYEWFDEVIGSDDVNTFILTAHHAEDVAETALLQLMRGRDLQILKGIHAQTGYLRRPLLAYRKQELVDYLNAINQPWREDPTNAQTDYLRNHMRNKVLPELAEVHPDPVQQLNQRLADYQQQQSALTFWLEDELDRRLAHSRRRFELEPQLPDACMRLMLAHWLRVTWFAEAGEIRSATKLLQSQKGRKVEMDDHELVRESDHLIMRDSIDHKDFEPVVIQRNALDFYETITHQTQKLALKENYGYGEIALYMMDADKVAWPMTLRLWQPGDRLHKWGSSKSKKVKDLLTDEKITTAEKHGALVLEDQKGIVWVQYVDVADRVAFDDDTSYFLTIHEWPLKP